MHFKTPGAFKRTELVNPVMLSLLQDPLAARSSIKHLRVNARACRQAAAQHMHGGAVSEASRLPRRIHIDKARLHDIMLWSESVPCE